MNDGIGIIGAGAIGAKHAEAARKIGLRIDSIIDNDPTRAAALAEQYNVPHSTDIAFALDNRATNAVVIAVPNAYHRPLAIAALKAGKDVLLEKPMALNETECREIIDVSRSTGRLIQMGFVHRYSAVGKLAKKLISENRLGTIYHVTGQIWSRRGVPGLGKWFTTKELSGGGALIDIGVHLLDLGLHLLGFPEVVEVTGQVHSNFGRRMHNYVYDHMWAGPPNCDGICDVEDSAHAFVRLQDGISMDVHVAWAGNFPEAALPRTLMGFFGDRGGMTFQLFGDEVRLTVEDGGRVVDQAIAVPASDPFTDQFRDFLCSISTRTICGPSGIEGLIVQSIVDRIYRTSASRIREVSD